MTIGIFDNLRLSGKMALIGATMLLGIGIPSYFYTVTMQENIVHIETELKGIQPANELILLQKLMAESRGTAAIVLNGGEASRPQLSAKIKQVESKISSVEQAMTAATDDDTLLRELEQIRADWKVIERGINQRELSAKESFALHSALIVRIDDVLSLVLNHFLMSYDPKAASYHLIVGTFEYLPRVIDSIGQVRGLGAGELSTGEIGLEIRGQLRGLLYAAEGPTKDFIDNIRAAANADERLAGMVKDANRAEIVMNSWFTLTEERVIRSTTVGVSPQEFFDGYTRLINDFIQIHEKASNSIVMVLEERLSMYQSLFLRTWTIIILLIIAATVIGALVNRSITTKAKQIIDIFGRIENGDYSSEFQLKRLDEMGQIEQALAKTNEALRLAAITNKEARRVKEALENSSTNIMIANNSREIIYCNEALLNMFKKNEDIIKDELPQFDAHEIIGTSIDIFHHSADHQAQLLANLTTTYQTTIQLGGLHFHASINPIFNEQNGRIGTVVEWTDRTAEINAEMEVASLVESILEGNFTKRIDPEGKEGFMAFLANGLNDLVEVAQKNLDDIAQVMQALSTGDLTRKVEGQYQGTFEDLKNYSNATSDGLAQMLLEIRTASETILDASNSIARGSSDLSSRTEQQASALEETASSMEELTSTVKLNAENANQASELSSRATAIAEHGGNLVEEVITTMGNINESAKQIADIISVIDGIAFQTNILALNAAVEAARAGEQGRGFAVVASEVRMLAQRSASAAKDIKGLISESVKKVERGNDLVNQSGQTMRDIVVSVKQVNDIMSDIAAASLEQANGIAEVTKAVNQMDEMTQSNASLVEQAASSADAMRNQAASLKMQVERFTLDMSDSHSHTNEQYFSSTPPEMPPSTSGDDVLNQQFEDLPIVGIEPSSASDTAGQELPKISATRLKKSQANNLTPNSAFNEDDWESF